MSYSIRRSRDQGREQQRRPPSYASTNSSSSLPSGNSATADSLANASSVIYLGNIPNDWDEQILSSVVAGSGKIVDIRSRIDPQGRNRNFCFVEYLNPQEASKALNLLTEIKLGPKKKLRVELSKEGLRGAGHRDRPILELNRNFIPYYVQIPAAMRENDFNNSQSSTPIPGNLQGNNIVPPFQQHQQIPPLQSATPPVSTPIQMPDVLAKAQQYLPPFNSNAFTSNDKISQNLQNIPPIQLIELLSTLKQLLSTDLSSAQQVFNMSPDIPITVVQAMVLLGLIDINSITTAVQQQISSSTPQLQSNNTPPPPPTQSIPQPPIQQQQPPINPKWAQFSISTRDKLSKLDPNEAEVIVQVLSLSPNDIIGFPQEQRQMVESIRSQYL
ncbi:hypothetical protein BN7_312 [Wickerhamomyces ciferrii]|uniref:RRM domain-containing protein n=1 Tax=Wickerhamomyces ciferrii (strain ATCC 14091 / BCRC 22168 / CBS 111 / JCM 3599 / NBRC 0793 / NRRL Y-1031 F-60-10) TaxID=1206466 RepID=K0KI18_WICCF|nr:uncharacterized protein BN7_312 [Wickerhamomyces ciferrii]CCH40778.1 hypothetical protein BN7_312 [Wickerhamomyces ciferrii]